MALKARLEQPAVTFEGRQQPRRTLKLETSGVATDGAEANVTIHNLSAAGLLIETSLELRVGEALAIAVPDVGPVGAEIVWASESLYGCAFEQALGEAALAAAQLRGEIPQIAGEATGPLKRPASVAGDSLGYRLNQLRRERGLTLAQVATALGVSKPTVWAWEKGKARPLPERIGAIAEVLGVSETDLADAGGNDVGSGVVEQCRLRIASEYGTSPGSVRIMIEV